VVMVRALILGLLVVVASDLIPNETSPGASGQLGGSDRAVYARSIRGRPGAKISEAGRQPEGQVDT
jgi:hypothetical protein